MPTGPSVPTERGTYQRELIAYTGLTQVSGTEYEVAMVATKLLASGQDERIKWARFHAWIYDTAQFIIGEWMLIKCAITDATQDLNDAAVIELLLKRGNLLKRGWYLSSNSAYGKVQQMKWEVFNVDLNDGEELRMLVRPIIVSGGATAAIYGELEYRIVGE